MSDTPSLPETDPSPSSDLAEKKTKIREQAHENRRNQADKDEVSRTIMSRIMELAEYQAASTVMFYVDVRAEVRTRHDLGNALETGKKIVVPYCVDGELELFHLENEDELEIGMYSILEPKAELREVESKRVAVEELDIILVPGVAFDSNGGRTGHGKGYYDKLLENATPQTLLVGVAFDCQMFPEIPMQSHDIYMDRIVTQSNVFHGRGR